MKKKFLAVFAALFVFGTAGAFAFDWSQCWCNYGGGVEKGDVILHVDTGLGPWLFGNKDWNVPYVEVGVNVAGYIWKLPFTFGGYVGTDIHGYQDYFYTRLFTGGDIAYHIQLPPKIMDLYAGNRIGVVLYLGDYSKNWNMTYDFYTGINFFFTEAFGLNVEVGSVNWLRAGLSFKF